LAIRSFPALELIVKILLRESLILQKYEELYLKQSEKIEVDKESMEE